MSLESTRLLKGVASSGFDQYQFNDAYRVPCSIERSGLTDGTGESAIWLGCNEPNPTMRDPTNFHNWINVDLPKGCFTNTRMHLMQSDVKALLPILQHFAETGELP